MRVHDVGVAGGPARRAREPEEEERQGEELPRRGAEVVHDPVAVGDPVVAEVGGRDDAHLEPGGTKGLDAVAHEGPGDVVRVTRIRRREDRHPHRRVSRWCASAAGAAIASSAST